MSVEITQAEAVNSLDWDKVYKAARQRTLNDATGTFYDEHLAREIAERIAAYIAKHRSTSTEELVEAMRAVDRITDWDEYVDMPDDTRITLTAATGEEIGDNFTIGDVRHIRTALGATSHVE